MIDYSKRLTIVFIMAILIVLLIFTGHNENAVSKKIKLTQFGENDLIKQSQTLSL